VVLFLHVLKDSGVVTWLYEILLEKSQFITP